MRKIREDLKSRLEHDENFMLKVVGEIGDMSRLIRGLIARVEKVERKLDALHKKG